MLLSQCGRVQLGNVVDESNPKNSCRAASLPPPHRRTIVVRIEDVDIGKRAKARGEPKIEKSTIAVPGKFEVSRPLQIAQIDHTKADIFVVGEEDRRPLGRPWLTLVMDVCSRMTATVRHGKAVGRKPRVEEREWGSLRGIDSSKLVPFVEDTD